MSEGNGNGYASKESFFGGFKRRWDEVNSPFGKVVIGSLSEGEHQQMEKEVQRLQKNKNEHIVRLIYMKWGCWNPDKTARMFSDADIKQIAAEDIDYAVTRSFTDKIIEHIGSTPDDIAALAKN